MDNTRYDTQGTEICANAFPSLLVKKHLAKRQLTNRHLTDRHLTNRHLTDRLGGHEAFG
jgi:hypothetical protein